MNLFIAWMCFASSQQELMQFVEQVEHGNDVFEGDEAEFHPEILDDPMRELGVVSVKEIASEIKPDLRTCQESGQFERVFSQTLVREEIPQTKKCLGHTHTEKVPEHLMKKTKEKVKKMKALYAQDPLIAKFSVMVDSYKHHDDIIVRFEHIDGASVCDHFSGEAAPIVKETWETEVAKDFDAIKNSPHCRITAVKEKDKTHRDLAFFCAPSNDSPCAILRDLGGVLVSKRCVHKNAETDVCILWEKTFNLSQRTNPSQEIVFEKGREIWGFNHELDPVSSPNEDLPQIRAIFSSLAEMPIGEGEKMLEFDDKMAIFNGKEHRCSESRKVGEVFDCCDAMTGCAPCSEKEYKLRKLRDEERCHYVGHYNDGLFDLKKNRVYCCFPTKLLKIFNEKMRAQIGDEEKVWGTPEVPHCHGFSLEEMDGKVDLSLLDLSEVAADFAVDEEAIQSEMEEEIREALKHAEGKYIFDEMAH